ncbi:MAG: AAA family ATPase [Vampirovibrio sp.]|nr:AAA family ATPase [Vampirovibrio sp.]
MSRAVNIIIIEQDPDTQAVIRQAAEAAGNVIVIAETDSLIYGYELVRQNQPQMVFVDLREDTAKTLEIVEKISTYFKDTMIVVSGKIIDLETTMACMQAGAREFIPRPVQLEAVTDVFNKHSGVLSVDTDGDKTGRIITVFSNKGGLGKTTIATNLALELSEMVKQPVALVDLNLQLGDITTFLDITPKQTIVDIAKNIGRVDAAYLESSLAEFKYGDSRVFVLADPLHVEDAEEVTAEQINTVLTVLKATFPYVIIDTTTSFDSKTLTALDLADNILLVSMVNLPCVRSSQRVLSLFNRLGYDDQKIKLVLNRYIPDEEITIEDVEDTLSKEVYWKIPNNYQIVMTSINRGIPMAALENSQSIKKNFSDLAKLLSGVVKPKETQEPVQLKEKTDSKSLLSSLFQKNK